MNLQDNVQQQTAGQLERQVSQKIQAFYRELLGHQPSKITCQLFGSKLAIVAEDSVTQPEQLLAEEGQTELAERVRSDLDKVLRPQLIQLIEETLSVGVIDMMSNATIETGRTGMIVVFDRTPDVRNPKAIPKVKYSQNNGSDSEKIDLAKQDNDYSFESNGSGRE
ncbi:MAG: DUF2294 domain-containing protein [Leptolyngbyaceae bacterium]|nr:DUF2294 domain-containing protein [Leptolyngbyaceae bacterium]